MDGEGNIKDQLKPEQNESEFEVYDNEHFCIVFHTKRVMR
jgi:hypothetical protein